jgi:hypothetical protein
MTCCEIRRLPRRSSWWLFGLGVGALVPQGPARAQASGVKLVALTVDNALLVFEAAKPAEARTVKVSGQSGTLLGIDFRPTDGKLYGLTSANNLYTLDPETGRARLVSTLTLPFDAGDRSGVDFNPQSDRLRLVGSNGQNLRVHPDLGATATDGALSYARGDPHFGKKPLVTACAYTNSVPRAPSTKTFDIDAGLDLLVLQEPPNDGRLHTVGPLGIDFDLQGGFDILSEAGGRERAFAVSGRLLYQVDLTTGAATAMGAVGSGGSPIVGLAVSLTARP